MKDYSWNDLLNIEIKYKDDHTVLKLVEFIKSKRSIKEPCDPMGVTHLKEFTRKQSSGEFKDGLIRALEILDGE